MKTLCITLIWKSNSEHLTAENSESFQKDTHSEVLSRWILTSSHTPGCFKTENYLGIFNKFQEPYVIKFWVDKTSWWKEEDRQGHQSPKRVFHQIVLKMISRSFFRKYQIGNARAGEVEKTQKKLSWHLLKTLMVCVVAMGNLAHNTEMANKETVWSLQIWFMDCQGNDTT